MNLHDRYSSRGAQCLPDHHNDGKLVNCILLIVILCSCEQLIKQHGHLHYLYRSDLIEVFWTFIDVLRQIRHDPLQDFSQATSLFL